MAAGKGTRMKSARPKVLHRLGGTTLLQHVLRASAALAATRTVIVTGHGADEVETAARAAGRAFVRQEPQLGTGHAVQQALPALDDTAATTLILNGDVPLIRSATAEALAQARAVFLTEELEAATMRTLPELEVDSVCIGVDFGKYDDYSAVVVVQGNRDGANVIHCEKHRRENWEVLVQRIADVVNRYPTARVICDETGTGDAVMALLRPQMPKHRLEGLVFTPATKTGLIDSLSMMFNRRTIRMNPNLDLLRELQHFEVTHRASGHLRMEAVAGYHDDLVIALALAVHGLVAPYHLSIAVAGKRTFYETETLSTQIQEHFSAGSEPDPI